ncbi:MAG: hypothetical protein MJ252_30145 [archaeon]|nr:hypothetical protein [archaeon]
MNQRLPINRLNIQQLPPRGEINSVFLKNAINKSEKFRDSGQTVDTVKKCCPKLSNRVQNILSDEDSRNTALKYVRDYDKRRGSREGSRSRRRGHNPNEDSSNRGPDRANMLAYINGRMPYKDTGFSSTDYDPYNTNTAQKNISMDEFPDDSFNQQFRDRQNYTSRNPYDYNNPDRSRNYDPRNNPNNFNYNNYTERPGPEQRFNDPRGAYIEDKRKYGNYPYQNNFPDYDRFKENKKQFDLNEMEEEDVLFVDYIAEDIDDNF